MAKGRGRGRERKEVEAGKTWTSVNEEKKAGKEETIGGGEM